MFKRTVAMLTLVSAYMLFPNALMRAHVFTTPPAQI